MADSSLTLPAENTDSGALTRLFLIETRAPHDPGYNRDESIKAMRLMRRVIENRLASPGMYSAKGAKTDEDIVRLGNQFAGFRDYPTLPANMVAKLASLLNSANGGQADTRQFVEDAISVACEAISVPAYPGVTAWRTAGATPPGGRFHLVATVQGNAFYATDPVPPVPQRHRSKGPLRPHHTGQQKSHRR